jgi:DNA polymerase elongation subunit (family B)
MIEMVLDIETMPDEISDKLAEQLYGKIEPTKTAIKEGTEAQYIQAKKDAIAEDFALSPMTGKVLGIGMIVGGVQTYIEDTETEMFKFLCNTVRDDSTRLITFNGKNFDVSFMKIRAAILGVSLPNFSTKRYDTTWHFDCREILTNFGANPKGTLKEWAIIFGVEPPKDSGKAIHLLTKEERQTKCLDDCKCTEFIFKRLQPLF